MAPAAQPISAEAPLLLCVHSDQLHGTQLSALSSTGMLMARRRQFTTFNLPAYAEQVLLGANTFALSYASKSVTDSRSELGLRTDKSWVLAEVILTLRGRAGGRMS
jgi:hypothetical protein